MVKIDLITIGNSGTLFQYKGAGKTSLIKKYINFDN